MDLHRRPVDRLELDNGLTVFFYDESKPIAGGRVQVQLLATIPISLSELPPGKLEHGGHLYEVFCREMGGTSTFKARKTRNFISEEDAANIFGQMKKDFIVTNKAYVSHGDFAQIFIRKKYDQWKKDRELRMLCEQIPEVGRKM